jgi:hypothetical protein
MIHNDDDANDIHDDHISHALNEINTSIMSNKSCESNDDKYRVLEDIDDRWLGGYLNGSPTTIFQFQHKYEQDYKSEHKQERIYDAHIYDR